MVKVRDEYIRECETPWENAGEGVRRQIMAYNENLMMVKVEFEKGAIGTPHRHIHTQASYVVSGRFEVKIGDEKQILIAGDSFYVSPDTEHGVVCLESGILIDTFNPFREDFLKG